MPIGPESPVAPWWTSGVVYQVYVRSFSDANGDGIGDLQGVIDRLDHLEWLGIGVIWLSPITVSPDSDWGYDVADFVAVHPALGSLEIFAALVSAAHARGIRVLLDFVPNHTSVEHPWFVEARASRSAARRDWYVWADPGPDGEPPNNWVSSFGGAAWTLDEPTRQYYLHNHLSSQPDLNWWNDDVRDAFDDIIRFWLDLGVDGFRVDVCNVIVKDAELRNNPPATDDDPWDVRVFGQRPVFNANRPEVHDVLRRWRHIADSYEPPRILLGETAVADVTALAAYYGSDLDELHLAFNFPFITAALDPATMCTLVEQTEASLPPGAWPAWTGSNHDMSRFATRWAGDDPRRVRVALVMMLGLRGTPVLYQGDEIGLGDRPVSPPDLRDPLGVRFWPAYAGRDPMRTPMPWRDADGGGFTAPGVEPWLPIGDTTDNVESQRADPGSMLCLTRDLIALRAGCVDLTTGSYATLTGSGRVWAWQRGAQHVVALNCSDEPAAVEVGPGVIRLATDRTRDGEPITGSVRLGAWEGIVAETAPDAGRSERG